MTSPSPNPQLLTQLSTLTARDELVLRLALREKHESLRCDQVFRDRIKALIEMLDPRPQEMAAIVAESREAETKSEETLLEACSSKSHRRQRTR